MRSLGWMVLLMLIAVTSSFRPAFAALIHHDVRMTAADDDDGDDDDGDDDDGEEEGAGGW